MLTLLLTLLIYHRYYPPRMTRDEALVFKTFDSQVDGRTRWTAHSAFDLPAVPGGPTPPPRESIETRAFVFFDEPRTPPAPSSEMDELEAMHTASARL